ncbi:MAG: hypothetical protein U1E21_06410 [Reyranellaceae bacterium]|jgi:hypothetical protein
MTEKRFANDTWHRGATCTATSLGHVGKPAGLPGGEALLDPEDAALIEAQRLVVVDGGWLDSKCLPREA